ncbi:MAG TPA: hypothetical protein VGF29_16900 [Hyphomicrobiaceae bacterium]
MQFVAAGCLQLPHGAGDARPHLLLLHPPELIEVLRLVRLELRLALLELRLGLRWLLVLRRLLLLLRLLSLRLRGGGCQNCRPKRDGCAQQ